MMAKPRMTSIAYPSTFCMKPSSLASQPWNTLQCLVSTNNRPTLRRIGLAISFYDSQRGQWANYTRKHNQGTCAGGSSVEGSTFLCDTPLGSADLVDRVCRCRILWRFYSRTEAPCCCGRQTRWCWSSSCNFERHSNATAQREDTVCWHA